MLCVHSNMSAISKKNSYGCYEKLARGISIGVMNKGKDCLYLLSCQNVYDHVGKCCGCGGETGMANETVPFLNIEVFSPKRQNSHDIFFAPDVHPHSVLSINRI